MTLKLKKIHFTTIKVPLLQDVDFEKIAVSNKISSGKKSINALLFTCIMLLKASAYLKGYDGKTK